jgi:hypothetical protein
MDNLFKIRTLTTSINKMRSPGRRMFQRHFAGKLNFQPSSRLAFDVISGNETILSTIKAVDPATIGKKTGRSTITMEAPRLAEKRIIHNYEVDQMRGYGEQMGLEMLKSRIAREQIDMRNIFDRTLEFWAANALRGKIYDADLTTILVDYNMANDHVVALTGDDLWTATTTSNPITQIRTWKRKIEEDAGHEIRSWQCWCGYEAMDALLVHPEVVGLLQFDRGRQIAEEGRIATLAGISFEEYNGSYLDSSSVRKRFLESDYIILIGEGDDVFECPYFSPFVETAGGVGYSGIPPLFFSKSWKEEDPEGRWIYGESRPLPVLKRPEAVMYIKVT